jgi:hypothetical protein
MLSRHSSSEQGAVAVFTALCVTLLFLFTGLALDFGRVHLLRAQLQTAVDAAALAGALQVVPMVDLEIDRWIASEGTCSDPATGRQYRCLVWSGATPVQISGPEWDLLIQNRWQTAAQSQCSWPYRCGGSPTVTGRKLILPPNTEAITQETFEKNALWPNTLGTQVAALSVRPDDRDPQKPKVTATARLVTSTSFLKLVGIRQMQITRSGTAVPVRR